MRVLVTGASGLLGRALTDSLRAGGDEVLGLRRVTGSGAVGAFEPPPRCDGVVHLAGENIAAGRWTRAKKLRIRHSRGPLTKRLVGELARLDPRPATLVSASAIGIYGDRGDEPVDEDSATGSGFLAEVCREWEAAAMAAGDLGIRVVCLRIGVVLSAAGGALAKMLPVFRLGLGGPLGDGSQYMSWVHIDDLTGLIGFCLRNATLAGPTLAVAPAPVTNETFTRVLASTLHRPAFLRAPRFALRLALGELADPLLFAGVRAAPGRALAAGFAFRFPELGAALGDLLGR